LTVVGSAHFGEVCGVQSEHLPRLSGLYAREA
jgi:hypothetical protein